ncbi:MAG TPA: outer membrane protein transport protein [Rhodopila sp.]|nr:outer membrane protein transport protein [Rhodopila sp.]
MEWRRRRGFFRTTLFATVAAGCLAGADAAHAAGFMLREGSADWMGNAFAGDTAKAYDASTAWTNPAGMVRLDQNEFDASLNGIFPSVNFSGANFVGAGTATRGSTGGNLTQSAATAGLFGVWSVTPDFKLGFAGTAPFGQRVANPGDFVGRYQSLVSSLTDEQFTISAAYRINDQFSIGAGPVLDFFSARLTQAINTGPTSALTGDPVADLNGSDVAVGYNLGVLYQATPALRFGLDYRSRIEHDINGTQSIYVPPLIGALNPLAAAQLNFLTTGAATKITLPDVVSVGAYWQMTPQLALMTDISWTDWSLLKDVTIVPAKPGVPGTVIPENWRNTVTLSVGANYRLTPQLMLQGGFSFDQSPVTDSNRTSRIPDSNRYDIGVGAQYDILPNMTLQVAYLHAFFDSAPVRTQASATSGVLVGTYSNSADTASLGIRYRF